MSIVLAIAIVGTFSIGLVMGYLNGRDKAYAMMEKRMATDKLMLMEKRAKANALKRGK